MPFVGDMRRTLKRMEADFAPTDRAGWRQKKLVSENVQRCSDFYQKVIILNSVFKHVATAMTIYGGPFSGN